MENIFRIGCQSSPRKCSQLRPVRPGVARGSWVAWICCSLPYLFFWVVFRFGLGRKSIILLSLAFLQNIEGLSPAARFKANTGGTRCSLFGFTHVLTCSWQSQSGCGEAASPEKEAPCLASLLIPHWRLNIPPSSTLCCYNTVAPAFTKQLHIVKQCSWTLIAWMLICPRSSMNPGCLWEEFRCQPSARFSQLFGVAVFKHHAITQTRKSHEANSLSMKPKTISWWMCLPMLGVRC